MRTQFETSSGTVPDDVSNYESVVTCFFGDCKRWAHQNFVGNFLHPVGMQPHEAGRIPTECENPFGIAFLPSTAILTDCLKKTKQEH